MGEIKIISTMPNRLSTKGIPAMMGEMGIIFDQSRQELRPTCWSPT